MSTDEARQLADRLDAAVILRVDQGKAARVLREQADEIDRLGDLFMQQHAAHVRQADEIDRLRTEIELDEPEWLTGDVLKGFRIALATIRARMGDQ